MHINEISICTHIYIYEVPICVQYMYEISFCAQYIHMYEVSIPFECMLLFTFLGSHLDTLWSI